MQEQAKQTKQAIEAIETVLCDQLNNKQKLLHMAYDIKSNAKLGFETSYIQFENTAVSTEQFEGYDDVIYNNRILWLAVDGNLDIDSDELIDRIVIELESIQARKGVQ